MDRETLKVKGVTVATHQRNRTIRLDILMKDGSDISLELPLPTVTRLTDQLITAEFMERRASELSSESRHMVENALPPDLGAGANAAAPPPAVRRLRPTPLRRFIDTVRNAIGLLLHPARFRS